MHKLMKGNIMFTLKCEYCGFEQIIKKESINIPIMNLLIVSICGVHAINVKRNIPDQDKSTKAL